MTIGERIRLIREQKEMSLEDVAKICGTSRQAIYKYENNIVTNIPYDRIIRLSTALGVSPAALMGWDEQPDKQAETISKAKQDLIEQIKALPEEKVQLLLQLAKSLR